MGENVWRAQVNFAELPEKPAYFRFLTILAFHVFLKEKVSKHVVWTHRAGRRADNSIRLTAGGRHHPRGRRRWHVRLDQHRPLPDRHRRHRTRY